MQKLYITILATLFMSAYAYAGSYNLGVSGSFVDINASGSETTTAGDVAGGAANTNSTSVDNQTIIASIFAEYEMDSGMVFGFEHVPGSADVSKNVKSRSEAAQGISGTDATGSVTRKAQAEVENLNTLYVEYPVGGYYLRVGVSQIDVNTTENAITSSGTYGNATLDGLNLGVGLKGSLGSYFTKFSVEYTDFEDLSLTSTTSNKISADLDTTEIKFAIGKSF